MVCMETQDGDTQLLGVRATKAMVGDLSYSTIMRRVREGTFPKPIVIGRSKSGRPTRCAWIRSELIAWNQLQIELNRATA